MTIELPHRPFYVMRHAQSNENVKPGASAVVDDSLSPHGFLQAYGTEELFNRLPVKPGIIISSDMTRTQETAIMMTGTPPHAIDGRLRERGKSEDRTEQAQRIFNAIGEHLSEGNEDMPLFLIHEGCINRMFEQLAGVRWKVPNTAIFRFDPPEREGDSWTISRLKLTRGKVEEVKFDPSQASPEDRGPKKDTPLYNGNEKSWAHTRRVSRPINTDTTPTKY